MKSWLYPGAKIVCVDANPNTYVQTGLWVSSDLTEGAVYVADWVGEFDHPYFGKYLGVTLKGIVRADSISENMPFAASRFRPLIDSSKTIESMKQMMRDHVANASGGMGIRKPVSA